MLDAVHQPSRPRRSGCPRGWLIRPTSADRSPLGYGSEVVVRRPHETDRPERRARYRSARTLGLVPAGPHQERGRAAYAHAARQPATTPDQGSGHRELCAWVTEGVRVADRCRHRRAFETRVLELVADNEILRAITEPMLRVRRVLLEAFDKLDRLCWQIARRDPVCRRLMTVPGVGVVVALIFRTGVDAPERFSRSRLACDPRHRHGRARGGAGAPRPASSARRAGVLRSAPTRRMT